jgi:hypothetical protein
VRAHVEAGAGREARWSDVVEEDEGPDQLPCGSRQDPAHAEPAEIACATVQSQDGTHRRFTL